MADKPKKLLDRVRDKLRLKNDSYATEKTREDICRLDQALYPLSSEAPSR